VYINKNLTDVTSVTNLTSVRLEDEIIENENNCENKLDNSACKLSFVMNSQSLKTHVWFAEPRGICNKPLKATGYRVSCYLNSVIQILQHDLIITDIKFAMKHHTCNNGKINSKVYYPHRTDQNLIDCPFCAWKKFYSLILNQKKGVFVDTKKFIEGDLRLITRTFVNDNFDIRSQNEAGDILEPALDMLHSELNILGKKPCYEMKAQFKTKCNQCHHEVISVQPPKNIGEIRLDLKKENSRCSKDFNEIVNTCYCTKVPEVKCDECKTSGKTRFETWFHETSSVVFINLSSYERDFQTGVVHGKDVYFNLSQNLKIGNKVYQLAGTINRLHASAMRGHFTNFIRTKKGYKNCDDACITKLKFQKVHQSWNPKKEQGVNSIPYVCMYVCSKKKKGVKRKKVVEINTESKEDATTPKKPTKRRKMQVPSTNQPSKQQSLKEAKRRKRKHTNSVAVEQKIDSNAVQHNINMITAAPNKRGRPKKAQTIQRGRPKKSKNKSQITIRKSSNKNASSSRYHTQPIARKSKCSHDRKVLE